MQHLKGFGLENFRVFKEYTWFDFAPITLLVGPNSSGKSSLTKGLWAFKNILEGDLSLKKDEDFLQLGNFERVFNNKFNNKILKFSEAVLLKNYPTFGENRDVKLFNEYTLSDNDTEIYLFKMYLELDDNLLYEIDYQNRKVRLNIKLFNKFLFVDEKKIKIKDAKIIDIEQPRESESLDDILSGKIVLGKEVFSDDTMNLEEVIKIYSDKKEYTDDFIEVSLVETVTEIHSFGDDDENYTYQDEYEEIEYEPLKGLLLKAGYSNNQAKFITESIFSIAKVQEKDSFFGEKKYEDLRKMGFPLRLEYHRGMKSNIQRIYRRIEDDSFNSLLSAFFEKDISNRDEIFLKKSGELFNLEGEITPIINKKYDTQTLEVSGLPLVEQGFGISQIVALLLKIITIKNGGALLGGSVTTLICEEPEANLHPAFQSKLADMFVDAQRTFKQQFIIETHSEYMIRKFQYLVAKGKMKKDDIVIYYFNDPNNIPVGEKQVKKINILEDGSLSDDFGSGFFDEADNLAINLFNLQNRKN